MEYPLRYEALLFSLDDPDNVLPAHHISVDGFLFYQMPTDASSSKVFCLKKTTDQDLDVFDTICRDLVDTMKKRKAKNELGCLSQLVNRLLVWISFLKAQRQRILSVRQQIGLLGELLVFYAMKPKFPSTLQWLNSWKGPEMFPKDFVGNDFELEIKTIFSDERQVKISSLNQLEVSADLPLFLNVLMVEEDEEGVALPDIVDKILAELTSELEINNFIGKLSLVRYSHLDKSSYCLRYALKNNLMFQVKDNFPRITKDEVDDAIIDTKYTLLINRLESYLVDKEMLYKEF